MWTSIVGQAKPVCPVKVNSVIPLDVARAWRAECVFVMGKSHLGEVRENVNKPYSYLPSFNIRDIDASK